MNCTPGALRAAKAIKDMPIDIGGLISPIPDDNKKAIEAIARVIDRESGVIELLSACKEITKFFYGEDGRTWRGEVNMKGICKYASKIIQAIEMAERE